MSPMLGGMMTKNEEIYDFLSHLTDNDIESSIDSIEKGLADFLGAPYFSLINSGLSALETSLHVAGVRKKDNVICDPMMPYSLLAIRNIGAIPIPVDIDPSSLVISSEAISKRITRKTKAIIATSVFGISPKVASFKETVNDIILIHDNAQSFGVLENNTIPGYESDFITYSFQQAKMLSCGQGGGIVSHSREYYDSIKRYISLGWFPRSKDGDVINWNSYWKDRENGRSLRLPPIAAALLFSRFKEFEAYQLEQVESVNRVLEKLKKITGIDIQKASDEHNGQRWRICIIAHDVDYAKLLYGEMKSYGSYAYRISGPPAAFWSVFNIETEKKYLNTVLDIWPRIILIPVLNSIDADREISVIDRLL